MFTTSATILAIAFVTYKVFRGFYRLFLHPLAHVPGPKLAALSRSYEFYYAIVLGGRWEEQVCNIHKTYASPIVRIGPNEVHVNDPEYYDTLYNFNPHLDKRRYAMDNLHLTPSHAQHKLRRHGLETFFSRGSILAVEWIVKEQVDKLCPPLNLAKETSTPAKISLLARCLTTDVITGYCIGHDYGFLDDPEKSEPFFAAVSDGFRQIWMKRESDVWEYITNRMMSLPDFLQPSQESRIGQFIAVLKMVRKDTQEAVARKIEDEERRTIFTEFPKNEKLPPSEKTEEIIFNNAMVLITAGLESTAHALETAIYHINAPENTNVLKKLKEELIRLWPNADAEIPSWRDLEKLPYFQAVLKESLRLSLGASGRLSRINHHEIMTYNDWKIPAGCEISMSQGDIHFNEDIYPDPWRFEPDRWTGKDAKAREKYFVSFSRGSRGCIGMNLALCEINTALATLIRRFDFELFDTDRRDVDYKYDYFVPVPETDKGVRVEVY